MKLFPVWGCFCGFKDSQRLLKGRAGGSKATHLGWSKGLEQTAATSLLSSWWRKPLRVAQPLFCSVNGALTLPSGGNRAYMYLCTFLCGGVVCVRIHIWLIHPYSLAWFGPDWPLKRTTECHSEVTCLVFCRGGNLDRGKLCCKLGRMLLRQRESHKV